LGFDACIDIYKPFKTEPLSDLITSLHFFSERTARKVKKLSSGNERKVSILFSFRKGKESSFCLDVFLLHNEHYEEDKVKLAILHQNIYSKIQKNISPEQCAAKLLEIKLHREQEVCF